MNITVIIVCIIIIIILLKIFDNIKNKRSFELLAQFPSHPTYPLVGNLHMVCSSMNDLFAKCDQIILPYDRLVFWFSSMPVLILSKHDDIVTILTQSHDRDTLDFANDWIGTGILNARYKTWRKSRKILAPAFSSNMLAKYTDVFNKNSEALANAFKQAADSGQVIDVWNYLIKANVDSIVENTIGVSIQTMGEKGEQFGDAVTDTFKSMAERVVKPWLHPRLIYYMYLRISKKLNSINQLHHLPTEILNNKLNDYRNGNEQLDDVDSSKTVLDLLVKGSLQELTFTEARMRDELLHIIGAAIETTALNLSFLMLMLAIHKDVQQKVYEEIVEILAENDVLTSHHLFNELKYLEQCIYETSRMYSPVIGTFRRTHKECSLKDDKIIPANTMVMLALHWSQLDDEFYKNPFKWDPEHFSEQQVQNRPKYNTLSFGYGPRSCLGGKYAILSIKTQIVHILRSYELSTNIKELSRKDLKIDVAIRSKIGYPIKFTNRQKLL